MDQLPRELALAIFDGSIASTWWFYLLLINMKKNCLQVSEISGAEVTNFAAKMKPVYEKNAANVVDAKVSELSAEPGKLRKYSGRKWRNRPALRCGAA